MLQARFNPIACIAFFALAMLASCAPEEPTGRSKTSLPKRNLSKVEPSPAGVAWFEGTAGEAMESAASSGKPVFLYWTSDWCPPCLAIESTAFRNSDFVDLSRRFILIRLNGDLPEGQLHGEQFGVLGYPTVLVLLADGTELTRLPGWVDAQTYTSVLELALQDTLPVLDILRVVSAGERNLSIGECRLLTYYSWSQSPDAATGPEALAVFRDAYDACPAELEVERSMLYIHFIEAFVAQADRGDAAIELEPDEKAEALTYLTQVLENETLLRSNAVSILFNGASMISVLTEPGTEERSALVTRTYAALEQLATDEQIAKRERVFAGLGKLNLERMDDPSMPVSDDLRKELVSMAAWADRSTRESLERHAVINATANVLRRAGLYDVAVPLLVEEIEESPQAFYFMRILAQIEEARGNAEQALLWLQRGYENAVGPATRFQWGYYYLSGLIELEPANADLILSTTFDVIRQLTDSAGFYQRPKAQLQRLEPKLMEWSRQTRQVEGIRQLRKELGPVCKNFESYTDSYRTCVGFLEAA